MSIIIFAGIPFVSWLILRNPFKYPYFVHEFDVSGKRKPVMKDYIDNLIIADRFSVISRHKKRIEDWKLYCEQRVERSKLKGYRRKQLEKAIDDEHAFRFTFVRTQTRYRQKNYVKTSYQVRVPVDWFVYNYEWLLGRYIRLSAINFECTLSQYDSKSQRKLMTRELREKIMRRDNYTCQICGKYMPDEVGLQIDHIVPIAKGGKSVPSNLQVLCSKCNGSKSDKFILTNL